MAARIPPCRLCGSRKFRLVAAQLVCSSGHVQRGFRIETAHEDDGYGSQVTTRSRTFNRSSELAAQRAEKRRRLREQRRQARGRDRLVIPGSSAHAALDDPDTALYNEKRHMFAAFQCLQLVLRMQIAAMHRILGDDAPPNLEAVARELWAKYVSTLALSPEPVEVARRAANNETPTTSGRFRIGTEYKSPANTAVILFIALTICRVPITLGDLRRCVLI